MRHLWTPMERAQVSLVWRPQFWQHGALDFRSGDHPPALVMADERERPVIMREVAWGQQREGRRLYTRPPSDPTERGGCAAGGVFICLPGERAGVYTPVGSVTGETPIAYRHLGVGVWRGWGLPDMESGDLADGSFRMGLESYGGDLVIQRRVSGTWQDTLRLDGTTGLVRGAPATLLKPSDQTGIGDSYANITGLGFPVSAGKTYRFHYWLIMQSDAATTGIDVSVNGPTAVRVYYSTLAWQSPTDAVHRGASAYDDDTAHAASCGTSPRIYEVYGMVTIDSSDGTLYPRAKRESVGSGPDCLRGSHGTLWQLD